MTDVTNNSELTLQEVFDTRLRGMIEEKILSEGIESIIEKVRDLIKEPWKSQRVINELAANLTENVEDLTDEDWEYLTGKCMTMIFDPGFMGLLTGVIEQLQVNIHHEFSKFVFYQEFTEWANLLIQDFPEKKYQIVKTFIDEYSACVNSFYVDTIAFRSLKGIEDDEPDVAARQILRAFGDIAESRYVSYLQMVYKMFWICELAEEPVESLTTGKLARTLSDLFQEHYSKYQDFVDMWIITIRNADAHSNLRYDYETEKITIFNTNPHGQEIFHREFTLEELQTYFEDFKATFWTGGLFHKACLNIILADFANWKGQISQLIEKASEDSEWHRFITD